ncbi:MAG: hypothetical protein K6E36_04975 [Oscillospiraceae bacterium]|nr:hypothetical protein [Oscillospiraceae bacterium]
MKRFLRKLAAAAMAFTLLGTGTAFTGQISAGESTLTAEAAARVVNPNTPHNHGYATYYYGHMKDECREAIYSRKFPSLKIGYKDVEYVYDVWICLACQRPAKKKLIQQKLKGHHFYLWYLLNRGAYD